MNTTSLLWISLALLSGCASSSPFLSADLVSMTRYSYSGGGLKNVGSVNEQFCNRDRPIIGKNKSTGLMDEVIYKAQLKYHADYIANASFTYVDWTWGFDCLILQGIAVRKLQHPAIAGSQHRTPSSEEEGWLLEDVDSVLPTPVSSTP